MNKVKLFVENILVYGLGGVIGKFIPIIMVPIITRMMPGTEYFGISDLANTITSFASAFAVMGMYDAMFRLFFDNEDETYKISVCSTAFSITCLSSIVVCILLFAFRNIIAEVFLKDAKYMYIVSIAALTTLVSSTEKLISAPTRMQNKRTVFLVTNTVAPLLSYSIAIPLLLLGYYIIALPVAVLLSGLIMELAFLIMNRKWFSIRNVDVTLIRPLLKIAIPLLPNFLIYWVFSSCDKLMITSIIGVGAAGIYSVGAKLGACSQLIYIAFAGGWQFFSFSTMKDENQVESNSKIFEYLGLLSFVVTLFVAAFSCLIFKVLFPEEYYNGYIIAPYLFLAPLLQMLFQIAANQFLIIKKTWPNLFILSAGAIVNVALNCFLIPIWGLEGAAMATLVGYIVADVICVCVLYKMKLMKLSVRFLGAVILFALSIMVWRLFFAERMVIACLIAILYIVYIMFAYRNDVKNLIRCVDFRMIKRR